MKRILLSNGITMRVDGEDIILTRSSDLRKAIVQNVLRIVEYCECAYKLGLNPLKDLRERNPEFIWMYKSRLWHWSFDTCAGKICVTVRGWR